MSGNNAIGGDGGGIYATATAADTRADLDLFNCTVSGNNATSSFFGGSGGAIFNAASDSATAQVSLQYCTIAANNGHNAGGIYNHNFGGSATVTLRNTILKNGATGRNFINSGGAIDSLGHNLCDDAAGGLSGTEPGGYLSDLSDRRATDPLLGPLQDNDGPTFTHALLSGSPAINAGGTGSNVTDQRGYLRRGVPDIGAFESNGIQLRVTSVARVGNDLVVAFQAIAGAEFRLQRKLALTDTWQNLPGVDSITPASDGIAQFVDAGAATLGHAFYQVELYVD